MAELTAADVATFTGGRLANNSTTTDLLNAALAAARRYVGWSVSPVATVELTVDGSGGRVLSLPTMQLLAVTELVEDEVEWDVADLRWSKPKGCVYKRSGACWTRHAGAITITISHGYTEAEAADWRRAILRLVDAMSYETVTSRTDPALKREKVDDTEQEWFNTLISTDERLAATFSQFRILPSP